MQVYHETGRRGWKFPLIPVGMLSMVLSFAVPSVLAEESLVDEIATLTPMLESARQDFERRDPGAFEAVLIFELPGRSRATVASLSARVIDRLTLLRKKIVTVWDKAGQLEEDALSTTTGRGLRDIEVLDRQSALLLSWARLFHTWCAEMKVDKRRQAFSDLLNEITQRSGWTELNGPGQNVLRCNALVMAAIAARHAGQSEAAGGYARQVISAMSRISDPGQRQELRHVSLLAILEQIRVLRDAGKWDAATGAVEQARQWAAKSRPEDEQVELAFVFIERSILSLRAEKEGISKGLFVPETALKPVRDYANQSVDKREAIYRLIARSLPDGTNAQDLSPFGLQLLAGGTLHYVLNEVPAERRSTDPELQQVIQALNRLMRDTPTGLSAGTTGELMFLLGRALEVAGRPLNATMVLSELAEKNPGHDRAAVAAERAACISQKFLQEASPAELVQARGAFVRAGRLFRRMMPDAPASHQLQYAIAVTLEKSRQWHEAADEYLAVPDHDPNAMKARLRRAICLRSLVDWAVGEGKLAETDMRQLADEAVQAARNAARFKPVKSLSQPAEMDQCTVAHAVLVWAGLLNLSAVDRPEEAADVLEGFEKRFGDCPAAVGQALRERIVALRKLKRMSEAREVVEQYLKTDSERAGPVMAGLLEAMREEETTLANHGNEPAYRQLAEESATLSDRLLAWSASHTGRINVVDLTVIRTWHAWAVLDSGHPETSLPLFRELADKSLDQKAIQMGIDRDIRLGVASSLLGLGKAGEAIELFLEVWRQEPEHSPRWWQAYVGSLQCHVRMGTDPQILRSSIAQQKHLDPMLGGPRWRRALEAIEGEQGSLGSRVSD